MHGNLILKVMDSVWKYLFEIFCQTSLKGWPIEQQLKTEADMGKYNETMHKIHQRFVRNSSKCLSAYNLIDLFQEF